MKIKNFFENRFGYCPIIVECMDENCYCTDIYSEIDRQADEKTFLAEYGECECTGWCMVDVGKENYLLLRIEN